ncbi:MAG: TonB-dependent receptor plug domain-containing protein [Myxococcota bacterium]|nr:TonB-dependent receptor plug domain-containing protein [Myxococcota bacterium]
MFIGRNHFAFSVCFGASLLTASAFAQGQASDLNLVDLLDLENVVTSASKITQTVAEAPSIISVLGRREIDSKNYRSIAEALSSIPGLFLNYDYAFYDVGVRGVTGDMRGASRLIKVMINGQPVSFRNETVNLLGPECIPMGAVERIEVIRGPGSALYGANAFLGVVNVITRKGAQINGVSGKIAGTSFNNNGGYDLGLTAGAEFFDGLDVLLSVQKNRTSRSGLQLPITTDPEGEDPRDAQINGNSYRQDPTKPLFELESQGDITNPLSIFASAQWNIADSLNLDGDFGVLSSMFSWQNLLTGAQYSDWGLLQYDAEGNGNLIGLSNQTIQVKYRLMLLGDLLNLTLSAAKSDGGTTAKDRIFDRDLSPLDRSPYGFSGLDIAGDMRVALLKDQLSVESGLLKGYTIINNLTLMAGADYTADDITFSDDVKTSAHWKTRQLVNIGTYGQLTGSFLNNRLGLIAGARYDKHNGAKLTENHLAQLNDPNNVTCQDEGQRRVCYDSFNYRGGFTVSLVRDGWSLGQEGGGFMVENIFAKALYGTAFKAPAPSLLYQSDRVGDQVPLFNWTLLPQEVSSLEFLLGFELWEKHVTGSVVYFINKLKEKVAYNVSQLGVRAQNADTLDSSGIEANLRLKLNPMDLKLAISQQTSKYRDRVDDFTGEPNAINQGLNYPELAAHASLTVDLATLSSYVTADFHFIGPRVGHYYNKANGTNKPDNRYELPSYHTLDLNYSTHDFELFDQITTRLFVSVRNVLNQTYAYAGVQPYFQTDTPGKRRMFILGIEQTL